jgi:hypothetical protein
LPEHTCKEHKTMAKVSKKKEYEEKKLGRPTDYSDEILGRAGFYLLNYKEFGDAIPSVAGLSHYLKIARSTIYDWASHEDKKAFSDILGEILSDQERTLLNNGLTGKFNPAITKLALGKHGYSDKQEVTGKDGEPLFDEEARAKGKQAIKDVIGANSGQGGQERN